MCRGTGASRPRRILARLALAGLLLGAAGTALAAASSADAESPTRSAGSPEEAQIRRLISEYGRAIERRDIAQFRKVKPNLSKDEEGRLRRAFESIQTHEVKITILSVEVQDARATARLARRDTINGSLVSSFPQLLSLAKGAEGWIIEQIGR